MEKYFIVHNDRKIEFELIRKRVKNINLRTRSDMSITVSANKRVPTELILDFVRKKAQWILKNQDRYEETQKQAAEVKEYVTGEKFMILGREICLNIFESDEEGVFLKDDLLEVRVERSTNTTRKRNLIGRYYKDLIDRVYTDSLERTASMLGMNFMPEMKIRRMVSRWGSCVVNRKRIIMNYALIYTPLVCIDYVMLHELLHFRYPGHNKVFYMNVALCMPDWKERKKILDGMTIRDMFI